MAQKFTTKKPIQRKKCVIKFSDNEKSDKESDDNSDSSKSEVTDEIDLTVPHISREKIEKIAGTKVNELLLYRRALVHKSVQKLVKQSTVEVLDYLKESNERLEFVGDSILGAVIADYLFTKYPSKDEGYLTKYRTRIVKSKTLSFFAEKIGIKDNILMSRQVVNMNGMENKRFLEDAFESFIGAIYYDKGFEAAKEFILNVISKFLTESKILKDDNYKDLLLRYAQFIKTPHPEYNTIKEHGQPHNRQFVVEVKLFGERQGKGIARIKKEAEQLAAKEAIKRLNITNDFANR